jgi:small conductance mechanosensitive channel
MGHGYAVLKVGVAYDADIDLALRLMREAVEALRQDPEYGPKILEEIEIAGVDELAESSVNLKARVKTVPQEQWKVRRELLRRIKGAFDANGIEIPFPHVTVYPGGAPAGASFPVKVVND